MNFDTEANLKELAMEQLPNHFALDDDVILDEFDYGKGVTDLVLLSVSDSYWNHRKSTLALDVPIRDKQCLITFLQLQYAGEITRSHFIESGAQPNHKRKKCLNWLIENKFVVETNTDKIQTAPNLRRHVTTSIAIELKLQNWKRALEQASMGRSFAEYRYVLIDNAKIKAPRCNIDKFKDYNVGLLSIDSDGVIYSHYEPNRAAPYSRLYKWKINENSVPKIAMAAH